MKPNDRSQYEQLADELLGYWELFRSDEDTSKIGKTLLTLFDILESFRKERDWQRAQEVCEMALSLLRSPAITGVQIEPGLHLGLAQLYLGAIHIGQERLDVGADYYEASARSFSQGGQLKGEGIACLCLGKVYGMKPTPDWIRALLSFQRGLNVLSSVAIRTRDDRARQIAESIEQEIAKIQTKLDNALRKKPKIVKLADYGARTVAKITTCTIPVMKEIAAGTPLSSSEAIIASTLDDSNVIDVLAIDENHARDASFALRVQGNSMKDAGILEGDNVLIRKQDVANNGEIAAVMIVGSTSDYEATLKKYFRQKNHHRLQPMNDSEKTFIVVPRSDDVKDVKAEYTAKDNIQVIPEAEVMIIGKMVGLFRM